MLKRDGMAAVTKTGPNNVRHIVWAISLFIYLFIAFYDTGKSKGPKWP